jgi:hypothetical protein
MSTLGQLAVKALRNARAVLGASGEADILAINSGPSIKTTRAEASTGRDYEDGGQQVEVTQSAVVESAEFNRLYPSASKEYLGKDATIGDDNYTVSDIERGEAFTTIRLAGEEESP